MDAIVTVRFVFKDVCEPRDLSYSYTFDKCVREIIESEGLFGVVEDDYEIVSVERSGGAK